MNSSRNPYIDKYSKVDDLSQDDSDLHYDYEFDDGPSTISTHEVSDSRILTNKAQNQHSTNENMSMSQSTNKVNIMNSNLNTTQNQNESLNDISLTSTNSTPKKPRQYRKKFETDLLIKENGLDKLINKAKDIHFQKYKSTSKKTHELMTLYHDWCQDLFPSKNYDVVLSYVENHGSKALIREYMNNKRNIEIAEAVKLNEQLLFNNTNNKISENENHIENDIHRIPSIIEQSNNHNNNSLELNSHSDSLSINDTLQQEQQINQDISHIESTISNPQHLTSMNNNKVTLSNSRSSLSLSSLSSLSDIQENHDTINNSESMNHTHLNTLNMDVIKSIEVDSNNDDDIDMDIDMNM